MSRDLVTKEHQRDNWEGIPSQFKHYHSILLRECAKDNFKSKWGQKPLTNKVNLQFLEYLDSILGVDNLRFKISGNSLMYIWSTTRDWEMMLKLSGEFPHHYAGILSREERQ